MSGKQLTLRVNGVDLNVADAGEGAPALLFLHYWGGSSRTWARTIQALSDTHRCVALDFRGWGRSSKDAGDHRLATLADDAVAVARELDLQDYLIVGHSMGGKVAQLVAARRPVGLKGLILVAPAPPTPLAVPEDVRQSYVALYQTREGVETVIGNLTPHPLAEASREQIIEDSLRGSPDAKREWPERGMVEDIAREASKIAAPVHVIAGGDDGVEPEASLRAAFGKVIPGAKFIVIPGVGHMAPLEAPALLAAAIRSALAA